MADASAKSLTPAIGNAVEPGSVVRTNAWSGYTDVSSKGYKREVIRQRAEIGDNLLPLVNRVVSLLKRWLAETHQGAVQPTHLGYYLDEFTFRFNRRTSGSRGMLFYRLLEQAIAVGPVSKGKILSSRAPSKLLLYIGLT